MDRFEMRLSDIRITVRPPDTEDDSDLVQEGEWGEAFLVGTSTEVRAIVEFGPGMKIPISEYVDWWGDGGTSPDEVVANLLFKAFSKTASPRVLSEVENRQAASRLTRSPVPDNVQVMHYSTPPAPANDLNI